MRPSTLAVGLALVAPSLAAVNIQSDYSTLPVSLLQEPSCTNKSAMVTEWALTELSYHESITFSNPAHQNSGATVNFTLENGATGYRTTCRANSGRLSIFFTGDTVYECDTVASEFPPTFTWSWPTQELKINQSWACPDEATHFTALGGAKLNLTCATDKWQNANWTVGSLYSTQTTDCDKVNVTAPIDTLLFG